MGWKTFCSHDVCLGKTGNKLITIRPAEETIRPINNKLDYIQAARRER